MTEFLHLTEAEQKELDELVKRTGDASLDRFCELLKKEAVSPDGTPWSEHALRESIKRMRPDFTEAQVEIFIEGNVRESGPFDLDRDLLAMLNGKEDVEQGLRYLGRSSLAGKDDLRVAFKRLKPNATERELDIMVSGKAPRNNKIFIQEGSL